MKYTATRSYIFPFILQKHSKNKEKVFLNQDLGVKPKKRVKKTCFFGIVASTSILRPKKKKLDEK